MDRKRLKGDKEYCKGCVGGGTGMVDKEDGENVARDAWGGTDGNGWEKRTERSGRNSFLFLPKKDQRLGGSTGMANSYANMKRFLYFIHACKRKYRFPSICVRCGGFFTLATCKSFHSLLICRHYQKLEPRKWREIEQGPARPMMRPIATFSFFL